MEAPGVDISHPIAYERDPMASFIYLFSVEIIEEGNRKFPRDERET